MVMAQRDAAYVIEKQGAEMLPVFLWGGVSLMDAPSFSEATHVDVLWLNSYNGPSK